MKKIKIMEDVWLNKDVQLSYDWIGWCEENLVNGFAKFLEYKYYGLVTTPKSYIYDYDFYLFLKENNFDGSKDSLKESSINFYKSKLN